MINIVLFNPEIPQNTGNIVRTSVVSGAKLHLIKPYGFVINEKTVRRAGLDYWDHSNIFEYSDFNDFITKNTNANIYLVTTKADCFYTEKNYKEDDYFIFGNETSGLPEDIHDKFRNNRIRIPMISDNNARCLNLSNSVSIIIYEALRQLSFKDMV